MADDQFTATLEWLLRLRRESTDVGCLLRKVRKLHLAAYSSQGERDVLRWATPEAEQVYDDLDRLCQLFDSSCGKFLQGPVVQHCGYYPKGTRSSIDLNAPATRILDTPAPDPRPVPGPGRRYGYLRGKRAQ